MEYSDLAQAVLDDDRSKLNRHMHTLVPRLQRFLRIHMNASEQDAEDCVQETILRCLERIRQGKLEKPEKVLSYLLTSCRNNYLKMRSKKREEHYEREPGEERETPPQLSALLGKEKQRLLELCMERLKEDYRTFIEYWFSHPDYEASMVADHFGISVNNAWTRKHRVINQLQECYNEESAR